MAKLPASPEEAVPESGDHDTAVLMHHDGAAQGRSEVPFMQDVDKCGVLTVGTGLGNARFINRKKDNGRDEKKTKRSRDSEASETGGVIPGRCAASNYDVQLHIRESRDSQVRNCAP